MRIRGRPASSGPIAPPIGGAEIRLLRFGSFAAIQDVLFATGAVGSESGDELKGFLERMVCMLPQMAIKLDGFAELAAEYAMEYDCEHELRNAEHERHKKPER